MKVESETKDTEIKDHCANIPGGKEEFGGLYHDNDDLDLQETLYQSLQRSLQIDTTRSYASTNPTPNHNDRSGVEENSSETISVALQLAADEALARELQEAETMNTALEQESDEALAEELQVAENQLADTFSQIAAENMNAALEQASDEALAKELQVAENQLADTFSQIAAETINVALEQASDEALAKELQVAENQLADTFSQIAAETMSADFQLVTDEALAKELQEADNQLDDTSISQIARTESGTTSAVSSPGNTSPTSSTTSDQVATEDDVDPDNMTYEELQTLGESVGAESRGLSDEQIALLPSRTYKIGFFSRKRNNEECVICCMAYKNRDKLITLPCRHQYHQTCATRWLKINKACPVCKEDAFGS